MIALLLFAALQTGTGSAAADMSQPPRLANERPPFSYQDYPKGSLQRGETGIVSVVLHVSPKGKVTSCDVTESSGFQNLDAATCSLLKSRARFDPAKDATGSPGAGEYRISSAWGLEQRQPTTWMDIPLQVSSLPSDYKAPVKTQLVFDATGHVDTCDVTTTSGSAAADRAACAYLTRELVIASPRSGSKDVQAAAVRYVTSPLSIQPVDASTE